MHRFSKPIQISNRQHSVRELRDAATFPAQWIHMFFTWVLTSLFSIHPFSFAHCSFPCPSEQATISSSYYVRDGYLDKSHVLTRDTWRQVVTCFPKESLELTVSLTGISAENLLVHWENISTQKGPRPGGEPGTFLTKGNCSNHFTTMPPSVYFLFTAFFYVK